MFLHRDIQRNHSRPPWPQGDQTQSKRKSSHWCLDCRRHRTGITIIWIIIRILIGEMLVGDCWTRGSATLEGRGEVQICREYKDEWTKQPQSQVSFPHLWASPAILCGTPWALLNLHKFTSNSLEIYSLFIMTIHQKLRDGSSRVGKLNLADLAGIHLPSPHLHPM